MRVYYHGCAWTPGEIAQSGIPERPHGLRGVFVTSSPWRAARYALRSQACRFWLDEDAGISGTVAVIRANDEAREVAFNNHDREWHFARAIEPSEVEDMIVEDFEQLRDREWLAAIVGLREAELLIDQHIADVLDVPAFVSECRRLTRTDTGKAFLRARGMWRDSGFAFKYEQRMIRGALRCADGGEIPQPAANYLDIRRREHARAGAGATPGHPARPTL